MNEQGMEKPKGRQRKYRTKDQMFAVIVADALAALYRGTNINPRKRHTLTEMQVACDRAGLLYDVDDDGSPVDKNGKLIAVA